jgi:hypothetical protein
MRINDGKKMIRKRNWKKNWNKWENKRDIKRDELHLIKIEREFWEEFYDVFEYVMNHHWWWEWRRYEDEGC